MHVRLQPVITLPQHGLTYFPSLIDIIFQMLIIEFFSLLQLTWFEWCFFFFLQGKPIWVCHTIFKICESSLPHPCFCWHALSNAVWNRRVKCSPVGFSAHLHSSSFWNGACSSLKFRGIFILTLVKYFPCSLLCCLVMPNSMLYKMQFFFYI